MIQEDRQTDLIQVGKVAAMVLTFATAVFEGGIEDTIRAQRPCQTAQGIGQLGAGDMQQTGAGPDAVEGMSPVQLLESAHKDGLAQMGAGHGRQVR